MIKLLITVIIIVSSLAGGFYVVYPNYVAYDRQVEENKILYEEYDNIMRYVVALKEIEKRIEENEEDLEKLEKSLPEDHDAPSLFLYLEKKIEENNLKSPQKGNFDVRSYRQKEVNSQGEEEIVDHERIKEVNFDLSLTGEYEDIKSFFKETEKLMRIITIETVNITTSGHEDPFLEGVTSQEDEITVSFSAKTYSY